MAKKKKQTKLEKMGKAAEELNQVLGLEPPIEIEDQTVNTLASKIREASELLFEDDEISDETAAVIADLTEDLDEPDEQEEAEEPESDEDEPEEELTLEDLREEVEGLGKRKDMRLLVEEIDLFEPLVERLPDLKSGSALKGAMLKHLGSLEVEEEEAPKAKAKKGTEEKVAAKKETPKAKPAKKAADSFEALQETIEEKKSVHMTYMADALLLEGGSYKKVGEKLQKLAEKKDLKSWMGGETRIKTHIAARKRQGYVFEEDGNQVQLVGIE